MIIESLAFFLITTPVSFKAVPISMPIDPLPIKIIRCKLPLITVAISKCEQPRAIEVILPQLPFVLVAVGPGELALSFAFLVDEVAYVAVTGGEFEGAVAVAEVVLEGALVHVPVGVDEDAGAVCDFLLHVADEDRTVHLDFDDFSEPVAVAVLVALAEVGVLGVPLFEDARFFEVLAGHGGEDHVGDIGLVDISGTAGGFFDHFVDTFEIVVGLGFGLSGFVDFFDIGCETEDCFLECCRVLLLRLDALFHHMLSEFLLTSEVSQAAPSWTL